MSAALAMAFTACQDDTSDLGIMQKNEAPVVVASNGVATAFMLEQNLDLSKYQNVDLPILDVAMNANFPESATLAGAFQMSTTEDFANPVEITYSSVAANNTKADEAVENPTRKYHAVVEGNAVENAFVKLYGKDPSAQEVWVRYNVYIQDGDQANILQYEGQQWWPAHKIEMTPVDQKLDVAASYTLFGNFLPAEGIVMNHSDKHQYDDPIFSITVAVSEEQAAEGYTWYITPTDDTSRVFGLAAGEEEEKSGVMVEGGVPGKLGMGDWKIEVNMNTKLYTITSAFASLYVPTLGNNNSFTRNCSQLYTDNFIDYTGMAYLSKGYGLTAQPRVRGILYTAGAEANTIELNKNGVLNADNAIPADLEGLYYLSVNMLTLKIDKQTYVEELGIVGELNGWGATDDIMLKPSTARESKYTLWTGEVTFSKEGEPFKIRANSDWAINYGGKDNELSFDGANLEAPGAGTYKVTVNFLAHPYTITLEPK